MKWVKDCCDKVNEGAFNEFGAWVETGKIGNQKVTTEFHAENHAMQKAYREAVQNGDVDSILGLKFKQEYV